MAKNKVLFMTDSFASPCRGIWRYILAANACYEIVIIRAEKSDNLSANDKAYGYISGVWRDISAKEIYYSRECLTGPDPVTVSDCLAAFQRDYDGAFESLRRDEDE